MTAKADHWIGPIVIFVALGFAAVFTIGCLWFDAYKRRRRARRLRTGPTFTLPQPRPPRPKGMRNDVAG